MRRTLFCSCVAAALCCCAAVQPARALEASRIELLRDAAYAPALVRLVEQAQRSVKVCMFQAAYYPNQKSSPDNQILQALIHARGRGVEVEVILDDGAALPEVAKSNAGVAAFLKAAGIAVYLDSSLVTTHTKCVIIDTATAVLGSTNWTYAALAKNHEVSAVISSPEAARELDRYFEMVKSSGKRF